METFPGSNPPGTYRESLRTALVPKPESDLVPKPQKPWAQVLQEVQERIARLNRNPDLKKLRMVFAPREEEELILHGRGRFDYISD